MSIFVCHFVWLLTHGMRVCVSVSDFDRNISYRISWEAHPLPISQQFCVEYIAINQIPCLKISIWCCKAEEEKKYGPNEDWIESNRFSEFANPLPHKLEMFACIFASFIENHSLKNEQRMKMAIMKHILSFWWNLVRFECMLHIRKRFSFCGYALQMVEKGKHGKSLKVLSFFALLQQNSLIKREKKNDKLPQKIEF